MIFTPTGRMTRWGAVAIIAAFLAALILPQRQPAKESGSKSQMHREAERLGLPWPPPK
jgi:hypothetical protein